MIYKRATAKLRAAGIEDIQIVKRPYGASPENIMCDRQQSQCFRTPEQAAQAVLNGFRPSRISPEINRLIGAAWRGETDKLDRLCADALKTLRNECEGCGVELAEYEMGHTCRNCAR